MVKNNYKTVNRYKEIRVLNNYKTVNRYKEISVQISLNLHLDPINYIPLHLKSSNQMSSNKRQSKIKALKPKPPPKQPDSDQQFKKDLQELQELQQMNRDMETMQNFMELQIEVEEQTIRQNYWDLSELVAYKGLCMTRHVAQQYLQAHGQRPRQPPASRQVQRLPPPPEINLRQVRQNFDDSINAVHRANILIVTFNNYLHPNQDESQSQSISTSSERNRIELHFEADSQDTFDEYSRQQSMPNGLFQRPNHQRQENRNESLEREQTLRQDSRNGTQGPLLERRQESRNHREERHLGQRQQRRQETMEQARQRILALLRVVFGPTTPIQQAQPDLFIRLLQNHHTMASILLQFNSLLNNQQYSRLYTYFLLGQQHQGPMTNVDQILYDPSFNPNAANQIVREMFRDIDVEQIFRNVFRNNNERWTERRNPSENTENSRRPQNLEEFQKEEKEENKEKREKQDRGLMREKQEEEYQEKKQRNI